MTKTNVLLLGVDGFYLPILRDEPLCGPAIMSLLQGGTYVDMQMPVPTLSGPGWATILTGVPAEMHGVTNNQFFGNRLVMFPDLLSQAFYRDQRTVTFAAAGWSPLVDPASTGPVIHERREQQLAGLHYVISREGESRGYTVTDAEITEFADFGLRQSISPGMGFVYFCGTDEAAHLFGTEGPEYRRAITRIDTHIGRLLSRVEAKADQGEKWLVAVVTDHGHIPEGGHGGDSERERASFVIAKGFGRDNPQWPQQIEPHELAGLLLTEREEN